MAYLYNPVDRPLTLDEIKAGHDWWNKHASYVARLIVGCSDSYRPVGSDMIHPELWKAAHWNWFIETHGSEKP